MQVNKQAWNISVQERNKYIGEAQKYLGLSPGIVAQLLTKIAIDKGYVSDRTPLSGKALISYAVDKKTPLWLSRSALDVILSKGYKPETENEWITFVSLYLYEDNEKDKKLPEQINKEALNEWRKIIQFG